jgi:hypothetical protein
MQGLRDDGTDIGIRQHDSSGEYLSMIGFQIKSFDDLLEKDCMTTLKAQRDDSFRKIKGLEHYYIVLCTDQEANKKRIRLIEAEFRNADRTRIIEPAFAYTFLYLRQETIDAYIKRTLMQGDIVRKKAMSDLEFPSRFASALVIYLTIQYYIEIQGPVPLEILMGSTTLRSFHDFLIEKCTTEDDDPELVWSFEDQVQRDLEFIQDQFVTMQEGLVSVRFDQVIPILALATEAIVRYEHRAENMASYLFNVLALYD